MSTPSTTLGAARFVGQSVTRKEDRRLVTGHGRYVDDVALPGMLHAAFVRSEVARATITSIDTEAARRLPGVRAVLTGPDLNPDGHQSWSTIMGPDFQRPFRPLAHGDVRFVGDMVAIVVADSRYVAEDACDLVTVEYESTEPVVDFTTSAVQDRLVHAGDTESNVMVGVPFTPLAPDMDDAFAAARWVVEETIGQHRYLCVPMECRGLVAHWDPGAETLSVVVASQSPHEYRLFFSRFLDVPEHAIHVRQQDVGGAFGQKMFVGREDCAVVLASKRLGLPVKWIEDRRENLLAASHSRQEEARVRMAIAEDGTITAITAEDRVDLGSYVTVPGGMLTTMLPGPYKIPRLGFSLEYVYTNTSGLGAYRGPWMFETTAREMMMDIAARHIGMDPVELRRRNMIRAEDQPYTTAGGDTLHEVTPLETLEQALEVLDYEDFRRQQAGARREGRYLGVGVSCYIEPTAMKAPTISAESAVVRIHPSGTVTVATGSGSHGQSIETTIAQVVADHLGVDYADVAVVQGDTDSSPYGGGTGGSRTAVIVGGAAQQASVALRTKVLAIAGHLMEAAPEDLELHDSVISVRGNPTASMRLAEVAAKAYVDPAGLPDGLDPVLESEVRFAPSGGATHSNATHVCTVEVDLSTCAVTVLRYIVSEDCGNMINPM